MWVCGQWAVEKGGEGEEAPITGAYRGIGSKGRAENFRGEGRGCMSFGFESSYLNMFILPLFNHLIINHLVISMLIFM